MSFLSKIFRRRSISKVQNESDMLCDYTGFKRKFDSVIQKERPPIKDRQKFDQLHGEFCIYFYGKYMKALRNETIDRSAAIKALEIAEKLTTMEPQRAIPWTDKCLALGALGRYHEALEANRHALEIDPSDSDKWLLQGNIFITIGKKQEAMQAFKRAKELK